MVFEEYPLGININKLADHLNKYVLPLEPIQQSPTFGGWSVLSSDGSYKDGWHKAHLILKQNQSFEEIKERLVEVGGLPTMAYNKPTEICHGYLQEVLTMLNNIGIQHRRVRIICLPPGGSSSWHRDGPDNLYSVRFHIPIITNSECFFEYETERGHMQANGNGYYLFVNKIHRVINNGTTSRYHLVMDVRDSKGLSKFHQYDEKWKQLEKSQVGIT